MFGVIPLAVKGADALGLFGGSGEKKEEIDYGKPNDDLYYD